MTLSELTETLDELAELDGIELYDLLCVATAEHLPWYWRGNEQYPCN